MGSGQRARRKIANARYAHQAIVERDLAAQKMQFIEIVSEGTAALCPQRRAQYPFGHERIAVAIAADPAAYAQEGGQTIGESDALACELLFELGVKPRQFGEERIVVIRKAVGPLVDHQKARSAHQIRLP